MKRILIDESVLRKWIELLEPSRFITLCGDGDDFDEDNNYEVMRVIDEMETFLNEAPSRRQR